MNCVKNPKLNPTVSWDFIEKLRDLQVTKILGFFIPGYFRN